MNKYYDKFRGEDKVVSILGKYLKYFESGNKVVDLGCGRGEFLQLLNSHNIHGIGIEIDPQMIRICKEKGLDVVQDDILQYLENNNPVDGVIASHVIEHMNTTDVERVFKNSYSILNSDGKMLIITPNPGSLNVITRTFWLDTTHIRFYPLELLVEMAIDAGFKISASGGDRDTIPNIRLGRIRSILSKIILRIFGLSNLFSFARAADDIYLVCVKD